jgi:hypothetical protein
MVAAAGHAAVIAEELEGIESVTGLHDGMLRDLDIIVAQLEPRGDF